MRQPQYQNDFSTTVAKKEGRRMKAKREQDRSVWFGLGMFGLVGWSIAIPIVAGIAIGVWIDRTWQHGFSCTLICLFVGVVAGCSIAWYWVKREGLVDSDQTDSVSPTEIESRENDSLEKPE